ncbi:carbohydrate ABC transporter permease [Fusibacter sp. 3D3]|uniref:carbohydrate ABC transporter permease n=1 Tax=Fusibacter sp. 3D3 TaxID=1048380 RepID=UPI0008539BA9|nr:sugar ABC transporter permease [Fusibacter sp. 3D3]GAU78449.1 N-acetyl-D-glucosamine ABC transport system [Fusibacter sp. 3D3]
MVGNKGIKKYLTIAFFLLPSLIGMLIFVIIPIIASFVLSFSKWDLIGDIEWVGLSNYSKVLNDPTIREAFKHTLVFIAGYLPLVLSISLGLALVMNKKLKGIVVFRALYFIPVISSWVAVSMIWRWLLNSEYGLINYLLSLIGIVGPGWLQDPKWAMAGVIMTSIWKDIGFIMVIYLAGLQEIPDHYYEAASIDGVNRWQNFWYITWPLLSPTTFFVITISLINSFQVFDQVWIMTAGGPAGATSVLVEQIYRNAFSYYKMGYASAISWVLFALIFIITIIQNKLQKKWVNYDE